MLSALLLIPHALTFRTHMDPENSCPLFMVLLDTNFTDLTSCLKEAQASLVAQW